MSFTVADFQDLVRLLAENAQWRAELRRLVLPDELAELPALVRRMAEWQQAMAEEQRALAAAQARTEKRLEELAAAQARTEKRLAELATEHSKTRGQLGSLTKTVGYTLENEAYKALPALLARDHGLIVEGRLKRGYLQARDGRSLEINILGRGRRHGEKVIILGESKAQLSKNNIDRFLNRKLKLLPELGAPVFLIFVTHMIGEADAEDYAREQGAVVYYSYDF
jgi:hypothetical protein